MGENGYEELDIDALEREFNESWEESENSESANNESEETETNETETETEEIEESEEDLEESETEDNETEEDLEEEEEEEEEIDREQPFGEKKPKQSKEENAAFAELRRQKEAAEQQARLLEEVAAQYGMTPEQFQAAWKQEQEEKRAESQGISVDVLRRMESLESQLNQQKKSAAEQKFWGEVDSVKAKYDLTDNEINKIFSYIGDNGLVNTDTKLPSVSFEFAYKAANFDNVIDRKAKEAKQQALAAKKKRQSNSAKGHNTNSNAGNQKVKEDYSVDEVEAMLRKDGLI